MRCFSLLILSLLILLALISLACAPFEDDLKTELQQFQGIWQAVSFQHGDGGQASQEEVKNIHLVIAGKEFTLTGKDYTITGTLTIDPAKTPKTIDVLIRSRHGEVTRFLGIYEIRGDQRNSCFALEGKKRPTQFTLEKGHFGFEWKRK